MWRHLRNICPLLGVVRPRLVFLHVLLIVSIMVEIEGLRHRVNGTNDTKLVITDNGKEADQRLDKHDKYVLL